MWLLREGGLLLASNAFCSNTPDASRSPLSLSLCAPTPLISHHSIHPPSSHLNTVVEVCWAASLSNRVDRLVLCGERGERDGQLLSLVALQSSSFTDPTPTIQANANAPGQAAACPAQHLAAAALPAGLADAVIRCT